MLVFDVNCLSAFIGAYLSNWMATCCSITNAIARHGTTDGSPIVERLIQLRYLPSMGLSLTVLHFQVQQAFAVQSLVVLEILAIIADSNPGGRIAGGTNADAEDTGKY